MKLFKNTLLSAGLFGMATMALASDPLANTQWQTFDNGTPKAVVRFSESGGVLSARIVSTNESSGRQYVGRTIITGLRADGGGRYSGGSITDPENGRTYRLTATLNGNTLVLRGHAGPFSRSQTWRKR